MDNSDLHECKYNVCTSDNCEIVRLFLKVYVRTNCRQIFVALYNRHLHGHMMNDIMINTIKLHIMKLDNALLEIANQDVYNIISEKVESIKHVQWARAVYMPMLG